MNDPLAALSTPHPAGFREIDVHAAAPLVRAVRVVDVREPDEFTGPLSHIQGAELVPLGTIGAAAAQWPREQPILLVCRSGGRSGRAAQALAQAGFAHVYNLNGGMLAWSDAALPVERA